MSRLDPPDGDTGRGRHAVTLQLVRRTQVKRKWQEGKRVAPKVADNTIYRDLGRRRIDQEGFNLKPAVERVGGCGCGGAEQGATTRNGHSLPRSCNTAMRRQNRAIRPVASPHCR